MTNLEQMSKILSKTTDDLTAYTKVFNNAAQSVIGDTEAMGRSAVDLREQLNKLLSDAQGLSNLGKNINLNDQGQVDGFVTKIKELDKTLSDLSPVILANLKEINTAFQREFKLDDGTTGYLKQQLNDIRAVFNKEATWEKDLSNAQKELEENRKKALEKEENTSKHKQINEEFDKLKKELPDLYKTEAIKIAPDLSNFAKDFVKQVDIVEYNMGRLTELGKQRNETEKALGFVVSQKDVAPIQEAKRAELADYDSYARGMEYSGINDKAFLRDFPDAAKDIDSINIYIKQLDDAVGKKIKGYVELFNEAQNLFKGGDSNKELYETIDNPMTRTMYGDNIDWNKMTPSGLKELKSGLYGGDEFDEFNNEFFGSDNTSSTKTAESIAKVEEASTKATASVRNYAEELSKLVESDTVLSSEQKQGILSQDFSDKVTKYGKDIEYFKNQLQSLGNTKLTDMPATQLDPNKTEDFTALTNYKSRITEAIDSLGILKEEQAKLFSNLADPTAMSKIMGSGISQEPFNDVKAVLESGYKVNLLDGSADKEKLDQLKAGFEQLISEFKGYNIDIVPDKDIEDLAKLNALQQAINTENKRQTETAQAQANYEKDKARYLEQYNKIAQAQANIKALESTRNNLMTSASKDEKKAISERYATEIANNKSIVNNAQKTIDKYRAEFAKHNLEIPVTPVVKANANLSGQFKSELMGLKASGRNEILGGLIGQEATIAKLNQQAQALGLNVDKINSRLSATSNTIKTAFYSGDIERARSLMSAYADEVDKLKTKVDGQSKAQDIAKERQRQAAQEAERTAKAQARAAEEQARAQQKAADEAQKAAEKEKRAYEESLNAAKQKITQGLSAIKSFADGVNNAVNKVVNIIRTGIRLVNKVISTAGKIIVTLGNGVKSIISLFGGLSNRVQSTDGSGLKLNSTFNLLKGSATELRSKIQLLKGALSTLFNNSMVAGATKLMSSVMSLDVIIGDDLTKSTIEWANSMQDAFGVDARGLISDLQEITGVLKGLGMNNQDISVMGPNLLSISRYLAMMGLAGGDAEMAMSKITSGLKGMTQAIDDLGLSVRESEMNDFLKKLKQQGGELANIGTKYANLNEEARIYVRSASILQQFLTNFGTFNSDLSEYVFNVAAFTRTLNSVTGRLSILKQAWSGFLSTVGAGLMKVAAVVAGYIIPVLRMATAAVERFFAWLSALTGINFNVSLGSDLNSLENIEDSSDGVKETTDGVSDLNDELEKVDENAKKAKGSLQSFDRVNNVTSSSSSNSDSGTDAFDYAKILGGFKKLIDPLNEEYDNFLNSLNEKNEIWWNQFKNWIIQKCKEITGRIDFDLGFDWDKIKQSLLHIKDNVLSLIKSWGTFFIEIGLKIADDVNIGAIITSVLGLTDAVTGLAAAFSNWLTPVLSELYDKYLSPLVGSFGQAIVDKLDEWSNKIKYITALIKILTGQPLTLDELILTNESETFNKDLEDMRAKLKDFQAKLDDIFKKISEGIRYLTGQMSLDEVLAINEDKSGWATFLKTLNAVKYIIVEISKDLADWAKNDALPWLIEKLKEIGKFISENKEKIVELIDKIAGIAWDGFKTFVDLVGKLIGFVVKNPDSVYGFFAGLLGLKVASWFTDVATSIGLAVVGMEGFTKALSGGALGKLFGIGATAAATAGGTAATAGGTAATAAGGATAAAGGAAAAGGVALGPILAVTAAVVALTAAIVDLWKTSEHFRDSVTNAWENIKNAFDTAKEAIAPAIESLKEAWSTFYESYESSGIKDILDAILSFAVEVLGGTLSIAISNLGRAIALVIGLLGDIIVAISGVVDVVSGFVNIIIGIFTLDGDTIKEGWNELVIGLVEIVSGFMQAIVDIIGNVGGLILDIGKNIFGGLFEGMSEAWNTGVENVKEWFNNWIDSIKEFFGIQSPSKLFAEFGKYIVQGLINGINTMWQTLVTGVNNLCNTFVSSVKNKLMSVVSVGSTLVNGIWSSINKAWSTLSSGVSRLCSNLINSIKSALGSGWNSITGWLNDVGNKISNSWNNITNKTSASKAKTVTTHAVGGSIAGGQLFIANENGQPELIGNIDGSPKTNVANNNMIIEAMTNGVFTGVYNALAEVSNQRGNVGVAKQNVNLKIDGFGLIDSSTLSELARMLAPYLGSNNKNIANINFSI